MWIDYERCAVDVFRIRSSEKGFKVSEACFGTVCVDSQWLKPLIGWRFGNSLWVYLLPCGCSFHGCCEFWSLLMYRYKSLGLCAGDAAIEDGVDGGPKFGMVLAKVIDDARRRLKIGDFWRLNSCGWKFLVLALWKDENCALAPHHLFATRRCRWSREIGRFG